MKYLLSALLLLLSFTIYSQSLYFPLKTSEDWQTVTTEDLGWCADKVDPLLSYLESRNTKAFILLKDGKIVIEKYFGTFIQDSAWYWASAGKTLTSFLIGIAQQENYLSINDTTSEYLGNGWTNCTPVQEEKITIRHQLTMTTGLDDQVEDHHCTDDTCLNYKSDAGTRWAYHNGPYTLLDSVIQSATGSALNDYIREKLKDPTGMTGIFGSSGYNNVFYSKARSMARFGLLILNRGNWNGTQIMTDATYFDQMVSTSQSLNKSYGYLWWLNGKESFMMPSLQHEFTGPLNPSAPEDVIMALGKNGQLINVAPGQNIVFIRMGNAPGVGEVPITFNDTIWQKLNEMMCNVTTPKYNPSENSDVTIFPNPARDLTTINLPGKKFDIRIYDCQGKMIYQKYNCQEQEVINTENYLNGIYSIKLTVGNSSSYHYLLLINN